MKIVMPLGRVLYSLIFILSGLNHFSQASIGYAESQGVPLAHLAVPLSGVIALSGGLSILLGYRAKWGATLILLFLLPVTFMMHAFWNIADPMQYQMQMIMFMKNLSLMGGALFIFAQGSGSMSMKD